MDQEKADHSCNQMDQLDLIRAQTRAFLKQRLLFWGLRWTIGFIGIWIILQFYPDLTWLWLAGGIVAFLSLVAILVVFFFLEKKMKSSSEKQKNLRDEVNKEGDVHTEK